MAAVVKETRISHINEIFDMDTLIELYQVAFSLYGTANSRRDIVWSILDKHNIDYLKLGTGTNRQGIKIGEYCFKIALDYDGMIDNLREFKYTHELYPYVIKVYECLPNGLIAVSEYVDSFTGDTLPTASTKIKMLGILKAISSNYLIGDIGLTTKNICNWGTRSDGSLCILDFAYIYSVKYNTFTCDCDHRSILEYDSEFVFLVCPTCGRKYEFRDIRKRITSKQQNEEIGNIREIGYCLTKPVEVLPVNPEFSTLTLYGERDEEKEEKIKQKKFVNKALKEHKEKLKKIKNGELYE